MHKSYVLNVLDSTNERDRSNQDVAQSQTPRMNSVLGNQINRYMNITSNDREYSVDISYVYRLQIRNLALSLFKTPHDSEQMPASIQSLQAQ